MGKNNIKFLGKLFFLLILVFWLISKTYWLKGDYTSTHLKNIHTNQIESFIVTNYDYKTLLELSLIKKINWKNIWDQVLDWKIEWVCSGFGCYSSGTIRAYAYSVSVDNSIKNTKVDNRKYDKFNIDNLSLSQKYQLFDYRVLKPLLIEFIVFLPLNLVIFHCLWYLLFLLFYKKYRINYFKRIYLNAWIFYAISFIALYYFWYWFTNFNAGIMGFFSYFFFIWLYKFILFLISRYTIERYNKKEKEKSDLWNNILLWYWILFCLIIWISFLWKILSNIF
jgi:hypothetical protein